MIDRSIQVRLAAMLWHALDREGITPEKLADEMKDDAGIIEAICQGRAREDLTLGAITHIFAVLGCTISLELLPAKDATP